jgi:hypothetical protein
MKKNKFPVIKKELKTFLSSEEGRIVEKDAVKLGITLVAIAGIVGGVMKAHDVNASCTHGSHGSHSNHASHSVGGWC